MQTKQNKVDYTKGMIYKICCLDASIKQVYIGSTTNFTNRKRDHKNNCSRINGKKYNRNVYRFIRANGGFENWTMVFVKHCPCSSKLELEREERAVLEQQELTLNMCVPSRGKKERNKEYREANKDNIKEYKKVYRAVKIKCACGAEVTRNCLSRHQKTKKHKSIIQSAA